jgi:hypothetical protein
MKVRWRVLLAVLGAALMCLSCAALVYVLWPLVSVSEQAGIRSDMFRIP